VNQPRMWWGGDDKGWIIDTETALTSAEVLRCAEFTARVQADRLRTLAPGAVKDECRRTIAALSEMKVTQNIVGSGDKVLFDAYKSHGKKIFTPS
jgi:hypothetical protein